MGMFGGGLANALSSWILLVIVISITIFSPAFRYYELFKFRTFNLKYCHTLLKIGMPVSIQYSVEILHIFCLITYLMGLIGTDALGLIKLQCNIRW